MSTGTVETFDEQVGVGALRADDGRLLPFHCTAIADGSRRVAVGAKVAFAIEPGRLGRWEAAGIVVI